MNHYISGIIKLVLIEGSFAARLIDRLVGEKYQRHLTWAFRVLTALLVLAWCNYGALRGNFSIVHGWEQFHFYLGAKYQKEVGWFDLYPAAVMADRESAHVLDGLQEIRNIHTFELEPVERALEEAPRIRAKFTDARWNEFKRDWVTMVGMPGQWARILTDHGNSNSPAWALLAHPIAELVPLSPGNQTVLGLIDLLLMGVLWFFVFKTFGEKHATVALFFWAAPPLVFDYLAGSFLRWDWIFALGLSMCFMHKGKWATAGALFGYAVATKLFPLFFGLALLWKAVTVFLRTKKIEKRYVRFLGGTVAAGLAAVILSSAMFGGTWVWKEYRERIAVAQVEKFYSIQYSLKTVYLQVVESAPDELAVWWFSPRQMKQGLPEVDIANHAFGWLVVRLAFTALVLLLILRADDLSAFALGPMLVFVWLTVNMYYWNMFGLLALGLARRLEKPAFIALLGLHVPFGLFYVYQHTNNGAAEGYIVALVLCVWLSTWAWFEWREVKGQVKQLAGLSPQPASESPKPA